MRRNETTCLFKRPCKYQDRLLFGSILLREIAHVIAARRFDIHTSTVLLWPLGGVALMSRQADQPWQDVVIAAAGPLTNVTARCRGRRCCR